MREFLTGALISIAVLAAAHQADAAAANPLTANAPTPEKTMTVGSLTVEKFGSGDPAVILIPGLACGSWVWNGTIPALAANHAVYAVTLAGFDGSAPTTAPMIDKADASLAELIVDEHLVKPVMIGHSLGGFLAIRFAEEHSDELSRAAAVDGLPVFPTMGQMSAEARNATAKELFEPIKSQSHDQFAASEQEFVAALVTDQNVAVNVAELTGKSDPAATAEYGEEMLSADLRPQLSKITVPFAEIVPIPKTLPPGYPPAMYQMTPDELKSAFLNFDGALFAGAKTVKFIPVVDARHFAMLDQPEAFNAALDAFVAGP